MGAGHSKGQLFAVAAIAAPLRAGAWPWGASAAASEESCTLRSHAWTPAEVSTWVNSLAKGFGPYADKFEESAIDGKMLHEVDENVLKNDLEITNKFHVKRIMNGIKEIDCVSGDALKQEKINSIQAVDIVGRGNVNHAQSGSVSDVVFKELSHAGAVFDDKARIIGNDLNDVFSDIWQETLRLETAEHLIHYVVHQSSELPDGLAGAERGLSLMKASKEDLPRIMDSKKAARASFYTLKSGVGKIVTAIRTFSDAARRGFDIKGEMALLKKNFHQWHETTAATMTSLFAASEDLHRRTQERMEQMTSGQGAVVSNIKAMSVISKDLADLNMQRRRIVDSDRRDVQLAIQAKAGALTDKIDAIEHTITEIEAEKAELEKIRKSNRAIAERVSEFVLVQNNKKQEWRDWHIRWCWANLWGPEMDKYDAQADRNIGAQNVEREKAEKAVDMLSKMLKEYDAVIEQKRLEKAVMQTAMATWGETLSSEGLLAIDHDIAAKHESLERARAQLTMAMQSAGVSDPEAAANAIGASHRVNMLMGKAASKSADVAHRVEAWHTRFDSVMERLEVAQPTRTSVEFLEEQLATLAHSMRLISDGYEHNLKTLEDGNVKRSLVDTFLKMETAGPQAEAHSQATGTIGS